MYLGIDVGTQSVKALLYDANSRCIVGSASSELQLISRADGSREQMAHWWIEGLTAAIAELRKKHAEQLACVKAIATSGQQHGFVPVGSDGRVLAAVKLWCDTATQAQCDEITEHLGGADAVIELAGNPILTGYTAPKVLHLKQHNPEAYAAMAHIMLPHDYLNYWLTGERVMEYGDASGTGLLDIRNRRWCKALLRAIDSERDLEASLPPLVEAKHCVGTIRSELSAELGLPATAKVATGGGDNMMAAFGTGSVLPGCLTVSLGTSGTLFAHSDSPLIDDRGELAAFCSSSGGWLPLLCTMNCTVATEQIRQLLGMDLDQLNAAVDSVAIGCDGVITLPFYNGERSPNLPNGKAAVIGLDMDNTTPQHLARSAMEGACFALRNGLDAFSRLGYETRSVRVTGGGSRSEHWRQMLADVFGMPVEVLGEDEGAAFGAALQALWMDSDCTLGTLCVDHIRLDADKQCQPDKQANALYAQAYERYQNALNLLTPAFI